MHGSRSAVHKSACFRRYLVVEFLAKSMLFSWDFRQDEKLPCEDTDADVVHS